MKMENNTWTIAKPATHPPQKKALLAHSAECSGAREGSENNCRGQGTSQAETKGPRVPQHR